MFIYKIKEPLETKQTIYNSEEETIIKRNKNQGSFTIRIKLGRKYAARPHSNLI